MGNATVYNDQRWTRSEGRRPSRYEPDPQPRYHDPQPRYHGGPPRNNYRSSPEWDGDDYDGPPQNVHRSPHGWERDGRSGRYKTNSARPWPSMTNPMRLRSDAWPSLRECVSSRFQDANPGSERGQTGPQNEALFRGTQRHSPSRSAILGRSPRLSGGM